MFRWYLNSSPMFVVDWTDDNTIAFEKTLATVGQVCIFIKSRDQSDDPYDLEKRRGKIISELGKREYIEGVHYIIIETPNIVGWYDA